MKLLPYRHCDFRRLLHLFIYFVPKFVALWLGLQTVFRDDVSTLHCKTAKAYSVAFSSKTHIYTGQREKERREQGRRDRERKVAGRACQGKQLFPAGE